MLLDTSMAKIYGGQARRWSRAWKGIAKYLDLKITVAQQRWEEIYQQKYDRIIELEKALRDMLDHVRCHCPLHHSVRKLLEKSDERF